MMETKQLLMRVCLAGVFLGILLIVIRAKSVADAFLDLQFRAPRDPVALLGNMLAIACALSFVLLKLSRLK